MSTPLDMRLQNEAVRHGLSGDKVHAYVAGALNRIKAHKRGNIQGVVMPKPPSALKAPQPAAASKTLNKVAPSGQKIPLATMLKQMK